ncbi:hypothetical protein BZL29_8441 [Mycobacterium kansasii]|uniref:Uncharacterized protein n=1 Tax=Mycobacterium kansasii TaxID=1768 RepID=A0A1V3W9U9_MYCKA|nr:hypothetical protein BZL29_8441 [Mycobacterium kansasii]
MSSRCSPPSSTARRRGTHLQDLGRSPRPAGRIPQGPGQADHRAVRFSSLRCPASDFQLVAEAQRIQLAGLFDPMLAVATSDVRRCPPNPRSLR